MYYTYILYSSEFDRIYIGQSRDINVRLNYHNEGKVRSTKAYVPWIMIHHEIFETRSEAMKREKELKTHKGRDYIRKLVRAKKAATAAFYLSKSNLV